MVTAAVYSDRYISDRFLPDKAIDLVDEASSALKLAQESRPAVLEQLDRSIVTLEIERESLKNEEDEFSVSRREKVDEELAEKKAEQRRLMELWNKERSKFAEIKNIKEVSLDISGLHPQLTLYRASTKRIPNSRLLSVLVTLSGPPRSNTEPFQPSRPRQRSSKPKPVRKPTQGAAWSSATG